MGHGVILAVDDEPDLGVLMVRILSRCGYAVTTASGVGDALGALASMPAPPDLLITDISMPDGTGVDLADEVHRRIGAVPVLYVSGHSRGQAEGDGLIPVGSLLLEKPFIPAQLADAVADALEPSAGAATLDAGELERSGVEGLANRGQ
jgi:DNA-binding NtrC family response regulator